jgi:hypothetical protein
MRGNSSIRRPSPRQHEPRSYRPDNRDVSDFRLSIMRKSRCNEGDRFAAQGTTGVTGRRTDRGLRRAGMIAHGVSVDMTQRLWRIMLDRPDEAMPSRSSSCPSRRRLPRCKTGYADRTISLIFERCSLRWSCRCVLFTSRPRRCRAGRGRCIRPDPRRSTLP